MGGLSDFLFGGSPKAKHHSFDTISPTQRDSLDGLIARLSGAAATPYDRPMSAGMSGGERMSLAALEQRSMDMASPQGNQNFDAAGSTLRSLMDFKGQEADTNAFFKSNVQDPLLEQFGREILPQISRQFGGADFFSSERQAVEGLAREDLLESLVAGKERVALGAHESSRDRALQAASQVPGLEQGQDARTRSMIDILDAAGLPRELAQQGMDRQYQDFLRMIMQDQDLMKILAQLVLTPTKENTTVVKPGSAGLVNTAVGALAGGFGSALGAG